MLRELRVSEMRYRAVLEVLDGAVISDVGRRYGVSRQTVHVWLRRYARDGAVLNLEDRSSRPQWVSSSDGVGGGGAGVGVTQSESALGAGPATVDRLSECLEANQSSQD